MQTTQYRAVPRCHHARHVSLGIVLRSALTAKANGIEPYAYLREVFTELPNTTSVEAIDALLPASEEDIKVAKLS